MFLASLDVISNFFGFSHSLMEVLKLINMKEKVKVYEKLITDIKIMQ
jgi:hypothetical protein